jgi:hypothetical protein
MESLLTTVHELITSSPETVFTSMFRFYQELGKLPDGDLLAAYNTICSIRAATRDPFQRKQAKEMLLGIHRIVEGKCVIPSNPLWGISSGDAYDELLESK